MGILKENRHPDGMIDLTIVPQSIVVEGKLLDVINKHLLKEFGSEFLLPSNHHIILINLGENIK